MGLIKTPHLYRCAISYAGVTDLRAAAKHTVDTTPKHFAAILHERIGNYRTERQEIEAVSPLQHVDQIRAPVFLAHGGRDSIVEVEQGRKLAKALEKKGKKYHLLIEPSEGHGFRQEATRINLYKNIESFLEENLK